MQYKILSSRSPNELTRLINESINDGWEVVGSHQVVTIHSQNRFSGQQHMDTRHEVEYTITMTRKSDYQTKLDIAIETLEILYKDSESIGDIGLLTILDTTLSKIK